MSIVRRLLIVAILIAALLPGSARACPFCPKVGVTLAAQMKSAKIVLIAKLVEKRTVEQPAVRTGDALGEAIEKGKSTFQIVRVLKGKKLVVGQRQLRAIYLDEASPGELFLAMGGVDSKELVWQPPLAIGEGGPQYVNAVAKLPERGARRLAFFQQHLRNKQSTLAEDAFAEFAKAPYEEVVDLKDHMRHDELVAWIKDPQTTTSRRRLYFTMLGVCGDKDDLPLLESLIKSDDAKQKRGLDALLACYLRLTGEAGLPLIEERFLKSSKYGGKQVEYTETYAAIQALRFHGEECDVIARERLMVGLRYMLDRPLLADLVIPDLARWKDWSVMDQLVKLFKQADNESKWVRVPVVRYLQACPLPEAKRHIEQLTKIDPGAVRRASIQFPTGGVRPLRPSSPRKKADSTVSGKSD
ncbi:MAG: hypothetical protein IID44_00370 [Planctomycetes bacterium]|nr:hypothetical protein [Planctomycetota bacterium]